MADDHNIAQAIVSTEFPQPTNDTRAHDQSSSQVPLPKGIDAHEGDGLPTSAFDGMLDIFSSGDQRRNMLGRMAVVWVMDGRERLTKAEKRVAELEGQNLALLEKNGELRVERATLLTRVELLGGNRLWRDVLLVTGPVISAVGYEIAKTELNLGVILILGGMTVVTAGFFINRPKGKG